ncbi:uncharacterized protein [Heterodontus francisci]|uniref:uncharacterized protein isoform X2 n=1 Tax=Heterodontus francisci TaxID=7792 RepID=UPI00355C4240
MGADRRGCGEPAWKGLLSPGAFSFLPKLFVQIQKKSGLSSSDSEEEESKQSEDKLDDFQKQMLREHQEALAKSEAQINKMNVIKERDRRKRIKISCDQLRELLPKFEGRRNDMASVLEMTVKYLELVQALVLPQERSRILSVPEGHEKWHKLTSKTQPANTYSAQETDKTSGRRKIYTKREQMKTRYQTTKGKKQALTVSAGISQCLPQLSSPSISAKHTMAVTGSSEQHVLSPTSYLPPKCLTTLSNGWEDHLQNFLTSSKTLAPVQQNGSPEGSATQPDNLSFNIPDQWNDVQDYDNSTTFTDKSFQISASTMDLDTSMNKSQASASKVKPELRKSFQVLDLDTLMTDNSLGNWPEVEPPVTTNKQCAEEEMAMVDLIFLSL